MRTAEEIVKKLKELEGKSFLGFEFEVLMPYLTFEQVRPFIKPETTQDQWGKVSPLTEEFVKDELKSYVEFAWGKAEDHRGISASRSVVKIQCWLWLLEDTEASAFAEDEASYTPYGAPILAFVSRRYEFPIPKGERVERMIAGKSCSDLCESCES